MIRSSETLGKRAERARKRIYARYEPIRASEILRFEALYEQFDPDFLHYDDYYDEDSHAFLVTLYKLVYKLAYKWQKSSSSSGIRLYWDDFYDEFIATAWREIGKYNAAISDFYLQEHIELACKCDGKDVIKKARRNKRVKRLDVYLAASLDAELTSDTGSDAEPFTLHDILSDKATSSLQSDVANRDLITRMVSESTLNNKERMLLLYLYACPGASFQTISDALNLGHKETARRLKKSLRRKLAKYERYVM